LKLLRILAERVGFEPTDPQGVTRFRVPLSPNWHKLPQPEFNEIKGFSALAVMLGCLKWTDFGHLWTLLDTLETKQAVR
jgi:hypothetical protein